MKQTIAAAALAMATWAPAVVAQVDNAQRVEVVGDLDAEWASYRYAWTASTFFEKYTRTRPLIQAHMQLRPIKPEMPVSGLQVRIVGKTTDVRLDADMIGRVTLPMSRKIYDEDAVLRLNRKKGLYYFSGRYSVRERDDGVYDAASLREACEQLISAQRESGYRLRLLGKKCAGVKFVYASTTDASPVAFRAAGDRDTPVPLSEGHPFEDNSMGIYKLAILRFADWPRDGRLVTTEHPLAIGTLYE